MNAIRSFLALMHGYATHRDTIIQNRQSIAEDSDDA
jgi:hypothetical protein